MWHSRDLVGSDRSEKSAESRYSEDDEETRANMPTAALVGAGVLAGLALYFALKSKTESSQRGWQEAA